MANVKIVGIMSLTKGKTHITPTKGLETDSVCSQSYYRPIHRRQLTTITMNTISTLSNLAFPGE